MRIAIPSTDGRVPNHIGHCQTFLVADAVDGKIVRQVELPNPGHGPGGPPPVFLAEQGVEQVIAWGMPPHARDIFARLGVKCLLGATGEVQQVLADFLEGSLQLTTEGLDAGGTCGHED